MVEFGALIGLFGRYSGAGKCVAGRLLYRCQLVTGKFYELAKKKGINRTRLKRGADVHIDSGSIGWFSSGIVKIVTHHLLRTIISNPRKLSLVGLQPCRHAVAALEDADSDFFAQIIHSEDQQDTEPGEKINFLGYRTGSQDLLHGRKVEHGPGKNDLDDDPQHHQLVA